MYNAMREMSQNYSPNIRLIRTDARFDLRPITFWLCDLVCEETGFVFSFPMPISWNYSYGWYTEMRTNQLTA